MHCHFRFNNILIFKCFKLTLLVIPPHVVPVTTTYNSVVVYIDGSTLLPTSGDYWKSNKPIIVSVGFLIIVEYPLPCH